MQLKSTSITVYPHSTETAFDKLLVSVGAIDDSEPVKVTIGCVGLGNLAQTMNVGDYVLYERNENEIYDVRLLRKSESEEETDFLVSMLEGSDVFGEVSRITDYNIWSSEKTDNNQQFKEDEAHLLRERLTRFEKQLNDQFTLNEQQARFVSERIDYLKSAIDRQGRYDWLHTSIGVFVSIAMTLGVSVADDNNFWRLIKEALGVPLKLLFGGQ